MKARFLSVILTALLALPSVAVRADVAETIELQQKKERIKERIELLLLNTSVDSLKGRDLREYTHYLEKIALIDSQIQLSQKETIDRISSYSGKEHKNYGTVVMFSLVATLMMALSFYFLYLMNLKLKKETQQNISYLGTVKEFAVGTVRLLSGEGGEKNYSVATNLIIILCLIFMLVSFSAYLFSLI